MNSTQRVKDVIAGKAVDRTPIYGWLAANLSEELTAAYGSVEAFEDKYEFDAAHIFGGPDPFCRELLNKIRRESDEFTPDLISDQPIFSDPDDMSKYENIKAALAHHKKRDRFCYVQTPGFFENFNGCSESRTSSAGWRCIRKSWLYCTAVRLTGRFASPTTVSTSDLI